MEFVHNISRIPWSVLNLWEVTDTKGCRVVSPISAISSSACGQPPLSNAEIEQVTYTRRFCSHANLFTPLLSTAFINLSVGSCETKRTCLLKELSNSWTQIWLKSSQWNFRYHFKAIENKLTYRSSNTLGKVPFLMKESACFTRINEKNLPVSYHITLTHSKWQRLKLLEKFLSCMN